LDEEILDRVRDLDAPSLAKYEARVARLVGEGYDEPRARQLACGLPPDDLKRWPPRLRYDLAEIEEGGASRDVALKEIRRRLDDWWFGTHAYKAS